MVSVHVNSHFKLILRNEQYAQCNNGFERCLKNYNSKCYQEI